MFNFCYLPANTTRRKKFAIVNLEKPPLRSQFANHRFVWIPGKPIDAAEYGESKSINKTVNGFPIYPFVNQTLLQGRPRDSRVPGSDHSSVHISGNDCSSADCGDSLSTRRSAPTTEGSPRTIESYAVPSPAPNAHSDAFPHRVRQHNNNNVYVPCFVCASRVSI